MVRACKSFSDSKYRPKDGEKSYLMEKVSEHKGRLAIRRSYSQKGTMPKMTDITAFEKSSSNTLRPVPEPFP